MEKDRCAICHTCIHLEEESNSTCVHNKSTFYHNKKTHIDYRNTCPNYKEDWVLVIKLGEWIPRDDG